MQMLLQLQDLASNPENVLGDEFAQYVATFIKAELSREKLDFKEAEVICNIASYFDKEEMLEILQNLYIFSDGYGLKTAAKKALVKLGLTETEIEEQKPIRSILLLEPNAFFRKRLLSALEPLALNVTACANREEAKNIFSKAPVDLLIAESQDTEGELWSWIGDTRKQRSCRYVIVSTASPEHSEIEEKNWVIAVLRKPYRFDLLLEAIGN